jgi:hypothetical protein
MSKVPEETHLRWLVENRNAIQSLMLEVLTLLRHRESELKSNVSKLALSHLMIAAAYSLWRAVFLGNVSLAETKIASDAEKFLLTLIRDNAIGYVQEREMREWTFGYYTNNARFRIGEIARRSPGFRELLDERGYSTTDYVVAAGKEPEGLWTEAYNGLQLAIQKADLVLRHAE